MSSEMNERNEDNVCTVCHNSVEIYAVGPCNHFVCHVCYVRMKFLCEQMDCPICRKDLKQIAFTRRKKKFDLLDIHSFLFESKEGIFSEDSEVQKTYKNLLVHSCSMCKDNRHFDSFKLLKNHMSSTHQLFSCDLCFKHLKLFSSERKFYTRQSLVEHKKTGDANDRSYKGHPLCEFCDERYFDNDALLGHLRKDHFFCHFCEADGVTGEFYCEYKNLQEHFGDRHYLCQMEECVNVQWSNAFRTEMDLKAHVANVHSKGLSKNQVKLLRNFDLDINYAPHHSAGAGGGGGGGGRRGGGGRDGERGGYGGRRGRGRGGGGGRGGGRSHESERSDLQTAQILSNSLAHGHVGVIDAGLLMALHHNNNTVTSMEQAQEMPWNDTQPNTVVFQNEFPTLQPQQPPQAATTTTGSSSSRSGGGSNNNTGANKKDNKNHSTMAMWLAHSVGRNVRGAEGFNQDFPTLTSAPQGKQSPKQSVWNKKPPIPAEPPPKPPVASASNASFGRFEVLQMQPRGGAGGAKVAVDAKAAVGGKGTGGGKGANAKKDEGKVGGSGEAEKAEWKPGSWKKKNGEEEVSKVDVKKGKEKNCKKRQVKGGADDDGVAGGGGANDDGGVTQKGGSYSDKLKEREGQLAREKEAIEAQRRRLQQERDEIQLRLLHEQTNGTSAVEEVAKKPLVPPGFQAKNPACLSITSTDFPPLPSSTPSISTLPSSTPSIPPIPSSTSSIPPGFNRL